MRQRRLRFWDRSFEVDLFIPLFEGSNLLFAFFQGIFLFAALGFLFLLCLPGKL